MQPELHNVLFFRDDRFRKNRLHRNQNRPDRHRMPDLEDSLSDISDVSEINLTRKSATYASMTGRLSVSSVDRN